MLAAQACNLAFDWLGVHGRTPHDWDVARHAVHPRKGALSFVDRRRQRLQLTWTACRKAPAIDKMLEDHRSRQVEDDPDAKYRPLELPNWSGLQRDLPDNRRITRAMRYFPEHTRLLEAVILHAPDERELVEELLASFDVTSPADQANHTRLFGIDVTVPEPWRICSANVLPGDLTLTYHELGPEDKHAPKHDARVRRRGLADAWYNGDPERLLTHETKADPIFTPRRINGHSAILAESVEPGTRLRRMARRHRNRRDLLWHDRDDNAVYLVTTLTPARQDPHDPEAFAVAPVRGWS